MAVATRTEHPHVVRVADILHGQPIVDGSRVSVAAIARFLNDGVAPEEIAATFQHLTTAAIYDAISYYLDHKTEMDALIASSTPDALQERYGFAIDQDGKFAYKSR